MTVFKTDIHSRTETRRLAAIPIACASINWFVQHLRKTVFFWERRTVEDRFHQVQNNLHDWWDWKSVGRDLWHHGGAAKGKPDHKDRDRPRGASRHLRAHGNCSRKGPAGTLGEGDETPASSRNGRWTAALCTRSGPNRRARGLRAFGELPGSARKPRLSHRWKYFRCRGQERFSLTVRTSSTILQIKHNIADLYGMAVESQRLHLTPEPEEFSQRGAAM